MHVKFEVCVFRSFGVIGIKQPPRARTHTHTPSQTDKSDEHMIWAVHCVHLAEITSLGPSLLEARFRQHGLTCRVEYIARNLTQLLICLQRNVWRHSEAGW